MNRPIINIKVSQLVKAKWNYKTDGKKEIIERLVNSATYQKSFGILAVRELNGKYEIIDGNHRLDAIKILKKKTVRCENFGRIKLGEAVLISKQRNILWFDDDTVKFAKLFKEQMLKEFTMDELEKLLPMDREELEGYEKLLDFNWDEYGDGDLVIEELGTKKVVYITKEELAAIEELIGKMDREKGVELTIKTVERVAISKETIGLWRSWVKRCKALTGWGTEGKAFEFAIVEAMNIPEGSLK